MPLVAITRVADAEDDGSRTRHLLDLARDLGTARDADAEALGWEGGSRGRVWTAWELRNVMALASRDVIRTIAIAKVTADGVVVEVRGRRPARPEPRQETSQREPGRFILLGGVDHRG